MKLIKNNFNLVLIITLLVLIYLGITFGTKTIHLFDPNLSQVDTQIIYKIRMPRITAALVSGVTLAASGVLIQLTLKNNLADSSILGFQSGATLFAMIVLLIVPKYVVLMPLITFVGGMLTFLFVYTINKNKKSHIYLILSGIAVNAIIGSLIGVVTILYAEFLQNVLSFTNGSLTTVSTGEAWYMLIYGSIAILITLFLRTKLEVFHLEDAQATNLGINIARLRMLICCLSVFLASISVSFVGIISFVGLVAPHISRKVVGNKTSILLPTSMLMGGVLVLGSDVLQRLILRYYEVPVGIIMSIVGGIFFLVLLMKENDDSF